MKKRILFWLFLTVFFISLSWSLFIPLWHFPDEQAHFGHVAYLAEGGQLPMGRSKDLTEEIAVSEQFLGTYRNKYGNTAFTFHPEYRLEYTDNLTGKFEAQINNQPLSTRKNFTDAESAYYPHFYYRVSGFIYRLFYQQDLFVRVFSLRLFWLFTHLLMVYFAYLIGRIVFVKNKALALNVAILTGFQPMLSFVASGVTNDNLHNLLFTAAIYFCLKLAQKISRLDLVGLVLSLYLGFLNKPQFWVALGIVVPVLFWRWRKYFIFILGVVVWLYWQGKLPYFDIRGTVLMNPDYSLWQHLKYTALHTFREVLPWYWGVFRWLSLTLPRWVNQVMMRILLVAGIGLVIKFWRRKFEPGFWIIAWSALIYFLALFFWDWQQVRSAGFPFGIQGRYYFPTLVPHMILLIIGLKQIWSGLVTLLNYWFIALNWIAFYWVLASYYDASNFKTFIIQASQYKPDFAKGWWLGAVLLAYVITTIIFVLKLAKHEK